MTVVRLRRSKPSALRAGLSALGALSLLGLAGCATAPPPPAPAPETRVVYVTPDPCPLTALENARPAFAVDVWSPERTPAFVGQPLSLTMRSAAPAYLNLFHISSSCKATQLVANKQVGANETARFPDVGMTATVKPPVGKERYLLVATVAPLDWRSGSDALRTSAGVTQLDMTPQQMIARLGETTSRLAPGSWNTRAFDLEIKQN